MGCILLKNCGFFLEGNRAKAKMYFCLGEKKGRTAHETASGVPPLPALIRPTCELEPFDFYLIIDQSGLAISTKIFRYLHLLKTKKRTAVTSNTNFSRPITVPQKVHQKFTKSSPIDWL